MSVLFKIRDIVAKVASRNRVKNITYEQGLLRFTIGLKKTLLLDSFLPVFLFLVIKSMAGYIYIFTNIQQLYLLLPPLSFLNEWQTVKQTINI